MNRSGLHGKIYLILWIFRDNKTTTNINLNKLPCRQPGINHDLQVMRSNPSTCSLSIQVIHMSSLNTCLIKLR